MKHAIDLYQGIYEIISVGDGTKYLVYQNPGKPPTHYTFTTKADSKEFIRDIVKLNLTDENAIKKFLKTRGIPINTESSSDSPTYCGMPISKDFAEKIAPSSSGISMSLGLFRYTMELIKNILRLSTEISRFELNPLKSFESDFNKKLYIKDSIELVQSFFSLLYQPYNISASLNEKSNWIIGGSTPISRFTYHFHAILLFMHPKFVFETYISVYNHALEGLCAKNLEICQKMNLDNPIFSPAEEMDFQIDFLQIPEEKIELLDELNTDNFKGSGNFLKRIVPYGIEIPDKLASYVKTANLRIDENLFSQLPEIKTIILKLSNDSIHYADIIKLLMEIEKYFFIIYQDSKITINCKDIDNIDDIYRLLEEITKIGKQLIVENINTYTSNINYTLSVKENGEYELQLVSNSLLQSIFLEMANILNNYNVTICKYPPCNNLVFSTKNKPAKCCCHNHYTNYKGLVDRQSKKLFQR